MQRDRRRRETARSNGGEDPDARVDLAHEGHDHRLADAGGVDPFATGRRATLDADELREVRDWLSDEKARDLGVTEEVQSLLIRSEATLAALAADAEDLARLPA
jgi:hypothetical protein